MRVASVVPILILVAAGWSGALDVAQVRDEEVINASTGVRYRRVSAAVGAADAGDTLYLGRGPWEEGIITIDVPGLTLRSARPEVRPRFLDTTIRIRAGGVRLEGLSFDGGRDPLGSRPDAVSPAAAGAATLIDVRREAAGYSVAIIDSVLRNSRVAIRSRNAHLVARENLFENVGVGVGSIGTIGSRPQVDISANLFSGVAKTAIVVDLAGARFVQGGLTDAVGANRFVDIRGVVARDRGRNRVIQDATSGVAM